jgi:hypothetical protein
MSRVNSALVPPFGFRFPRNFPAEDNTWITSDTVSNLAAAVLDYRVINKIPIGSPETDIETYICSKWPNHCTTATGSGGTIEPTPDDQPKNLRERISAWAANRYSSIGAIEFVAPEEAQRRASICEGCPHNTNWRFGCPPCISHADRDLLMIRQANSVPNQDKLMGCDICGHDNGTSNWLPLGKLQHAKKYMEELPDFCWLKEIA